MKVLRIACAALDGERKRYEDEVREQAERDRKAAEGNQPN